MPRLMPCAIELQSFNHIGKPKIAQTKRINYTMNIHVIGEFPMDSIRHHPWTTAIHDPTGRYYDLKAEPQRIRTDLEDLKRWDHYQAVKDFYDLLEWINDLKSVIESNDSAFDGPHPNTITAVNKPVSAGGRLMIFFSDLTLNTSKQRIDWFLSRLKTYLQHFVGPQPLGYAQLSRMKTLYTALPGSNSDKLGEEVVIEFWAWGDTEEETMENMRLLINGIVNAIKKVTEEVPSAA